MLEGYLLQNIVIMSHLKNWFTLTVVFNSLISPFKRMLLCVFLVFLQHSQNKYSHLFWICGVFQVWAIFASVKASGWPWPQCPGLNRSQTAQTSSPSLRQLPPGVIVVTTNDWQPPGCQSKCDLLRPHCVEKWFEPQNELWVFFSFQHYHHHNLEYWTHDGDERICNVINKDWKVLRETMKTNSDKCWLDVKRTALG